MGEELFAVGGFVFFLLFDGRLGTDGGLGVRVRVRVRVDYRMISCNRERDLTQRRSSSRRCSGMSLFSLIIHCMFTERICVTLDDLSSRSVKRTREAAQQFSLVARASFV